MPSVVSADTFEAPCRRTAVGVKVLNAGRRTARPGRSRAPNAIYLDKGLSVSQSGYILIVESDDLIRELLESWLGEAGYRVVTNSSASASPAEQPSLVIANVSTP